MNKDTLVEIGVLVTAVIGLLNLAYSLRHNRRASYVGSVTATRLKWIGEVRDKLSRFGSLVLAYSTTPSGCSKDQLYQSLTECRLSLLLQLAPHMAGLDQHFQTELEALYKAVLEPNHTALVDKVEALVEMGQRFLWEEWMKVKREAIDGDPYDTFLNKLRRWSDD